MSQEGLHLFNAPPELRVSDEVENEKDALVTSPQKCVADIIFVHGLLGGAYVTWRIERLDQPEEDKDAKNSLETDDRQDRLFWPSDWLSNDLGDVRIISTSYANFFKI